MSDFKAIPVGKETSSLDVSAQFAGYSGIEIVDADGNSELVGTETGRVLTIEGITREQAQSILNDISGFQYQPFTASAALLNPAAEIGDAVIVSDLYSGVYKLSRNYTPNMTADIEAPQDEEIDHEYPYEPKQDRVYKREISQARAQIKVNSDSIEAEVLRASEAEGSLSSRLTQTAEDISAEVSRKVDGENNSSTFGWKLTADSWELYSGGLTVFKATKDGVEVTGKITASSGTIGGFNIGTSALYNGMTNLSSSNSGVYIGTDGIAVGGGNFKVTSSGTVLANNMTLTGTLNIGGSTITAANLRTGAYQASQNYGTWNTGSGYGYNYNNATKRSGGSYPTFFQASTIACPTGFICKGHSVSWKTLYIDGIAYNVLYTSEAI